LERKVNKLVKTENEHLHASGGLVIPFEVSDGITKATLIESRNYLESELDQWHTNPKTKDNPDGYWLHSDDLAKNYELIRAMNLLINYYGGE
jgi:hypothetical protein